jgi:translation initiation factor 5B
VKNEFIHEKSAKGSVGIKLVVNGLESTGIPGSRIINLLKSTDKNKEENKQEPILEVNKFKLQDTGVTVHASTMGSLEALIRYLQVECDPPVPICQVGIGKVMRKDVIKTHLANEKTVLEFKSILAFNVGVDEDAELEASNHKVKIFKAEIIYHLFDSYSKYKNELFLGRKESVRGKMTFPCILKILPDCVFNKKNPLVFGVEVLEGNLHLGTEISDPMTNTYIGKVIGIQNNNKDVEIGKKSSSVCIKVDNQENPTIAYGRQFDHTNTLCSRISRESLDVLKEYYRSDCTKEDLQLLVKLKKLFVID